MVMPGSQRGVGTSISAGRGSAQTLTLEDSEALSSISSVKAVALTPLEDIKLRPKAPTPIRR